MKFAPRPRTHLALCLKCRATFPRRSDVPGASATRFACEKCRGKPPPRNLSGVSRSEEET